MATLTTRRKTARQDQAFLTLERRVLVAVARPFAAELETSFVELGADAEAAFLANVGDAFAKASAEDRSLARRVMDDLNLRQWTNMHIKAPMERHYVRVGHEEVDAINSVYSLGVSLSEPREAALLRRGGTRAGLVDVNDATRKAILRGIEEGRENDLGAKQVARLIREYVPAGPFPNAGPSYRAELISRAESKTAQNYGSIQAYKDHPNVNDVQAADARIGDVHDADCEARDGQEFPLDEAEQEELTHPNCSLSWTPIVR